MSRQASKHIENQRNRRKAVAEETLTILQEGGYWAPDTGDWVDVKEPLQRAVEGSFVLQEEEEILSAAPMPSACQTKLEVTSETSLEALYRLAEADSGQIVLLNFASAKNPGGGFLGGAQAQEESLARASGLYPCLTKFKDEMYAKNRSDPRGGFYSDNMIFSSHVPFFRTDAGSLLPALVLCSVITCPAVNAGIVAEGKRKEQMPVMQVMEGRLHRILHLARAQRGKTLILGAWGCGVFRNAPQDVARLFREALELPEFSGFAKAVFAVPDERMKAQFADVLLGPAPEKPSWRWDLPLRLPSRYVGGAGYGHAAGGDGEPMVSPEVISASVDLSPPDSPTSVKSVELVSIDLDGGGSQRNLELKLVSFGYSRGGGVPAADLIYDARHIKNPQKGPQKHLTGLDARLRKEVMANDGAPELLQQMLREVLNGIAEERALVVAVGCTHGKHRSVTFIEELSKALQGKSTPAGRRLSVQVWHRERGSWSKKGRWRRGLEGDFQGDDDED